MDKLSSIQGKSSQNQEGKIPKEFESKLKNLSRIINREYKSLESQTKQTITRSFIQNKKRDNISVNWGTYTKPTNYANIHRDKEEFFESEEPMLQGSYKENVVDNNRDRDKNSSPRVKEEPNKPILTNINNLNINTFGPKSPQGTNPGERIKALNWNELEKRVNFYTQCLRKQKGELNKTTPLKRREEEIMSINPQNLPFKTFKRLLNFDLRMTNRPPKPQIPQKTRSVGGGGVFKGRSQSVIHKRVKKGGQGLQGCGNINSIGGYLLRDVRQGGSRNNIMNRGISHGTWNPNHKYTITKPVKTETDREFKTIIKDEKEGDLDIIRLPGEESLFTYFSEIVGDAGDRELPDNRGGAFQLRQYHPFFSKFSYETTLSLLQESDVIHVHRRKPLFKEGESESSCFLVLYGSFLLFSREAGKIGTLKLGTTIGENCILSDHNMRDESCYAQTNSCALKLFHWQIQELKDKIQGVPTSSQIRNDYLILISLFKRNKRQKDGWKNTKSMFIHT